MKLTWKQCTATVVSVATAVAVVFQTVEIVMTKVNSLTKLTTAMEQDEMGPPDNWREEVKAELDTLKTYHEEE